MFCSVTRCECFRGLSHAYAWLIGLVIAGAVLGACREACAQIEVTTNSDPNALGAALFPCGGYTLIESTLSAAGVQCGTYSLGSAPNNYGIAHPGIVMSTGLATIARTGPNTRPDPNGVGNLGWTQVTVPQATLLNLVAGLSNFGGYYNCAELTVTFSALSAGPIAFECTFGSEEYSYFVGSYNDVFGIFLNGSAAVNNIAMVAGSPISVNHPGMAAIAETELNGVLAHAGSASVTVTGNAVAGTNTLKFIIADINDPLFDSAVYISAIRPVCPPPVITQQPVEVAGQNGQTVTFSIAATGTPPLQYQWLRACNGRDWSPVTGANPGIAGWDTPTLTVGPLGPTTGCNCQYRCDVTDGCCNTVYSSSARLLWPEPLLFTQQPVTTTVIPGMNAVFTTATSGSGPITYQWYRLCPGQTGATPLVDDSRITGSTGPILALSPALASECGCSFVCSAAGPCYSINSAIVSLNCGCTPPPRNMVLWLPFDEMAAGVAKNLCSTNDGAHLGFPNVGAAGKVQQGICFDGNGAVDVQAYTGINLGTGDFTIDAWIMSVTFGSAERMIIDKRYFSPQFTVFRGYALYLDVTGRLALTMSDGAGLPSTYITPAPAVTPNAWTHVAVTVTRNSAAGVTFFVNGIPSVPASPATTDENGTLSHDLPLRVGGRVISSPTEPLDPFYGCIDEVEIFARALAPVEIARIALADYLGKCKVVVGMGGWVSAAGAVGSDIDFWIDFNNVGAVPDFRSVGFEGNPHCPASPPSGFETDPDSPVLLAPGQLGAVRVTVPTPVSSWPGLTSCFDIFTSGRDGVQTSAAVALVLRSDLSVTADPEPFGLSGESDTELAPLMLHNHTASPMSVALRARVFDDQSQIDLSSLSLNGQAPGVPALFELALPAGGSSQVPLTARFASPDPLHFFMVLLETDSNRDGVFEPLHSVRVHEHAEPDLCQADFDGDGSVQLADVFGYLSAWFAQDSRTDFDGIGGIAVPDIFAFLSAWFAGCP